MIENPDNYDDSSEEYEGEAELEEWKEGEEYEYGGDNGLPPQEEGKRVNDEPEKVMKAYAMMEKEHLFDGGRMSTA